MRVPNWGLLSLVMLCSTLLYAQSDRLFTPYDRPPGAPGAPGTATPQPFSVPQPRHVPSTAPNNPPLLNRGGDRSGLAPSLPSGTLAPPDGKLPLLEQQLQRNSGGRITPSKDAD